MKDIQYSDEHNRKLSDTLEFKYEMIPEERKAAWSKMTLENLNHMVEKFHESMSQMNARDRDSYAEMLEDLKVYIEYQEEVSGTSHNRDFFI